MHRRNFIRCTVATAALGITACKTAATVTTPAGAPLTVKPTRLNRGDKVMLICPGGPVPESRLQKAVENLQKLEYEVVQGQHVLARYGFVAGTDEERLADLHAAFKDPTVKAVWPVRGGYGCTRLLPMIDFELIRNNPKLLIGYSDITALLMAFYQKLGIVGIHGPLGSSTFSPFNERNLIPLISQVKEGHSIDLPPEGAALVGGKARGVLVGGNLSLLAAMAGTSWTMDATNKLVFLEDVGESPYRIDRMLTQLRQSAHLDRAKGIILGEFVDCEADPEDNSLSLRETLEDRLKGLGIPTILGLPFGHGEANCALPVGIMAELDADAGKLTLLETAVS